MINIFFFTFWDETLIVLSFFFHFMRFRTEWRRKLVWYCLFCSVIIYITRFRVSTRGIGKREREREREDDELGWICVFVHLNLVFASNELINDYYTTVEPTIRHVSVCDSISDELVANCYNNIFYYLFQLKNYKWNNITFLNSNIHNLEINHLFITSTRRYLKTYYMRVENIKYKYSLRYNILLI
jgi:hypothetical protein